MFPQQQNEPDLFRAFLRSRPSVLTTVLPRVVYSAAQEARDSQLQQQQQPSGNENRDEDHTTRSSSPHISSSNNNISQQSALSTSVESVTVSAMTTPLQRRGVYLDPATSRFIFTSSDVEDDVTKRATVTEASIERAKMMIDRNAKLLKVGSGEGGSLVVSRWKRRPRGVAGGKKAGGGFVTEGHKKAQHSNIVKSEKHPALRKTGKRKKVTFATATPTNNNNTRRIGGSSSTSVNESSPVRKNQKHVTKKSMQNAHSKKKPAKAETSSERWVVVPQPAPQLHVKIEPAAADPAPPVTPSAAREVRNSLALGVLRHATDNPKNTAARSALTRSSPKSSNKSAKSKKEKKPTASSQKATSQRSSAAVGSAVAPVSPSSPAAAAASPTALKRPQGMTDFEWRRMQRMEENKQKLSSMKVHLGVS